jgi:hypothetical protein
MTAVGTPEMAAMDHSYRAGACNIGPQEIARRRRSGHAGTVLAIATFGLLVAAGAPRATRLAVALPATAAAAGYLQARLRFCAGFGLSGVANFGPLGDAESITDADARDRDRQRALQIGAASLALGAAAGLLAALAPVRRAGRG